MPWDVACRNRRRRRCGISSGQWSQVRDVRLCPAPFFAKLSGMKRWQFRQAFVLILGLLVALGMSLSAVQASSMAAKMATSGEEMASGASDCSCTGDMGGAKIMVCDAACVAPVTAAAPPTSALPINRSVDRPLMRAPVLSSWAASPNPHPPKFIAHS